MGAQPILEPDGNHNWNLNCIINHRREWTLMTYSHQAKVKAMRRRSNNRQKDLSINDKHETKKFSLSPSLPRDVNEP